jgi:SAM-dependent methyltransferase
MSRDPRPTCDTPYIGSGDAREAERLGAQETGAVEELRAALVAHPPVARPRVLELGCGSGVFTRALLAVLPDARVTAVDRDERLLDRARTALTDAIGDGRVELARADVNALPYAARRYDLVLCRCVLMHQPDPFQAVSEMFRVAEIGGVALAIEPDWGARALYPDADALTELLDLARRGRPHGFPDLMIGRKLYALFRAAGFAAVRIQPTAFSTTADEHPEVRAADETGPGRLLEQGRVLLRGAGLADDAAIDALIARFAALARNPEYFSAGLDFAAVARKPAPRWPE